MVLLREVGLLDEFTQYIEYRNKNARIFNIHRHSSLKKNNKKCSNKHLEHTSGIKIVGLEATCQTGRHIIRRTTVRETDISRHHVTQIKAPLKPH